MSGFGDKLRTALALPCSGKRRYDTYTEAHATAVSRTTPGARDFAKFLQPYKCEQGCGGFHLTSRPFRDRTFEWPVVGDWKED